MNKKGRQYRIRECVWSEGYTSFHAEHLDIGDKNWISFDPVSFQLSYELALDRIKSDRAPYIYKELENNVESSYRISEVIHEIK